MSFLDKVKSGRGSNLYLSRGRDQGRDAWFYVMVDPLKVTLFLKAYEKPGVMIDLEKYGKIIESGWGENPPEDVVKRITDEYGG